LKSHKKVLSALAKNELIGLKARVVKSSDPTLENLSGVIVDETMNTLGLEAAGKELMLDKKSVTLSIKFPGEELVISGKSLMQRPEERLKKLWTKVK